MYIYYNVCICSLGLNCSGESYHMCLLCGIHAHM